MRVVCPRLKAAQTSFFLLDSELRGEGRRAVVGKGTHRLLQRPRSRLLLYLRCCRSTSTSSTNLRNPFTNASLVQPQQLKQQMEDSPSDAAYSQQRSTPSSHTHKEAYTSPRWMNPHAPDPAPRATRSYADRAPASCVSVYSASYQAASTQAPWPRRRTASTPSARRCSSWRSASRCPSSRTTLPFPG